MRSTIATIAALLYALSASAQERVSVADVRPKPAAHTLYWNDFARGWHFYEDPEPEEAPPKAQTSRPTPPSKPTAQSAETREPELVEFERLQKRLEEYRNVAIMRPSEANVRRYMELEAQVVRQASYFADVAQRVAWANPDLDMTLEGRPVNAQAIEVFDREQSQERRQTVSALASTHVLFFFYRSDCPYCKAFAPTLQAFQARYGLQIVPISVDGGALPGFPQFRRDNGIAATLQVTQVPALFLAEPTAGKIFPIGSGVLSESQLLERIATVTAPGPDASSPPLTRQISLK